MKQITQQCTKCKAIVKKSDLVEIRNKKDSEELGVDIFDLCCPHCNNTEFANQIQEITGLFKTISEFHEMIGSEIPKEPTVFSREEYDLQMWMFGDESDEFITEFNKKSIVGCARELGNMIYILGGMAIKMNIPIDEVLNEIHRANMTKGDGSYNSSGKWMKGPNYKAPDIASILENYKKERNDH